MRCNHSLSSAMVESCLTLTRGWFCQGAGYTWYTCLQPIRSTGMSENDVCRISLAFRYSVIVTL
jgi:hypothetical protein